MFKNGSLVTLVIDKSHGEGDDAISLKSGICGMIAQGVKKPDGNHQYTVDFGPYGAWYCFHNELGGDDSEGWEPEDPRQEAREANNDAAANILRLIHPELDEDADEEGEQEDQAHDDNEPEMEEDYTGVIIDVEKDIQRRAKQLEKGV